MPYVTRRRSGAGSAGSTDRVTEEIDAIFLDNASASDDEHTVELWGGDRFSLEARGDETVLHVTRAAPAGESWDGITRAG
jgi:hypothetical protein